MARYPSLVFSLTQAHLCHTPFRNVSRDDCATPHKNTHENFSILSLHASRDMISIADGPLRSGTLPDGLFLLAGLIRVKLMKNSFSGSLPGAMSVWKTKGFERVFRADGNRLSGSVGAAISANLPEDFTVNDNLLSGIECTKIARFSAVVALNFSFARNIRATFKSLKMRDSLAIKNRKRTASFSLRLTWTKLAPTLDFLREPLWISCDTRVCGEKSLAHGDARFRCTQVWNIAIHTD